MAIIQLLAIIVKMKFFVFTLFFAITSSIRHPENDIFGRLPKSENDLISVELSLAPGILPKGGLLAMEDVVSHLKPFQEVVSLSPRELTYVVKRSFEAEAMLKNEGEYQVRNS